MKIDQAYIRPSMDRVFPMFRGRWGLKPYADRRRPAVLFGCYGDAELRLVDRHRAPLIMVWLGSDFALFGTRPVWRRADVHHVAIGPWLARDLEAAGLPYRRLNLVGSPLVDQLSPEPLGTAVYSYMKPSKLELYGGDVLDAVRAALPDVEFIVFNEAEVPQSQMPDVYRRCALGLRLTRHDGGSEGVVEMGLMGRRSVHNGDTPASLPWRDAEDVVRAIEAEIQLAGKTLYGTASAMREHIATSDEWLDLRTWSRELERAA
jgi:hypothetical protein